MTGKAPLFRQMAPLPAIPDVDESALENAMKKLRVPTLQPTDNGTNARPEKLVTDEPKTDGHNHPSQKQKNAPAAKKSALLATQIPTPVEKLTVELPGYLIDELKLEALKRRASVRHLIMLGLQRLGMQINDADLVPDGRRAQAKVR